MNHSISITSDWLRPAPSAGDAPVAVICFPPAGGGAVGYRSLIEPLRAHADVYAASLPGREFRLREEPALDLEALVSPLASAVAELASRPLVVFGHSFGALLAYEVVHRLCDEGIVAADAAHLVVSGRVAAHLASRTPRLSHLPARDIVFRIAELHRNIPAALLAEPDYVAMIGRALQADLRVNEQYVWPERSPLPCPITAVGGLSDPVVSPAELNAWERHTHGGFESRILQGDHFYFRTSAGQQMLLDLLEQCCSSLAAPHGAAAVTA